MVDAGVDDGAFDVPKVAWSLLSPQLVLFVGAVVLLVITSLVRTALPRHVLALATSAVGAGSVLAAALLWDDVGPEGEGARSVVGGVMGVDRFSLFVTMLLGVAVILTALLADGYLRREDIRGGELYLLMLFSATGGSIMAGANDLIVMFLGIEILSIAVYVMAALHLRRLSSREAGFKYFVLGALSSAILLYGIAFLYGSTGSTSLVSIQQFLSERVILDDGMLLLGLALVLAGFAFKVGAAPFHMWTPDVYQGSPSPVVAYMASAVKVAAFAGLLRVFVVAFSTYRDLWRPLVIAAAVLSLFVGSLTALVQTNVKRMLAYSSIAHAGFILVGVEAASEQGTAATLFYLAAYTVMAAGSFGVVTLVGRRGDSDHHLSDYRGLARSNPTLAFCFTVLLLAQAGTPFTIGFLAKFGVIGAAVDESQWVLAVAAMISAVISAYLYLRVIVAMYFEDGEISPAVRVPRMAAVAIGVAVVVTVVVGVVPRPLERLTEEAVPEFVIDE